MVHNLLAIVLMGTVLVQSLHNCTFWLFFFVNSWENIWIFRVRIAGGMIGTWAICLQSVFSVYAKIRTCCWVLSRSEEDAKCYMMRLRLNCTVPITIHAILSIA